MICWKDCCSCACCWKVCRCCWACSIHCWAVCWRVCCCCSACPERYDPGVFRSCMYVFISSWIICWEVCCCFWICSASDCIAPSHSAWAPSAPRSILLLAAFLSIMASPYQTCSLQKSLVYPHRGTPEPLCPSRRPYRVRSEPLIHRSAWKGYSPQLDFRFTALSEVRSIVHGRLTPKITHMGDVPGSCLLLGCQAVDRRRDSRWHVITVWWSSRSS